MQSTPVSPTMARNSVQYKVAAKKLVKQNEKMNEVQSTKRRDSWELSFRTQASETR